MKKDKEEDEQHDRAERVRGATDGVPCEGCHDLECAVRRRGAIEPCDLTPPPRSAMHML